MSRGAALRSLLGRALAVLTLMTLLLFATGYAISADVRFVSRAAFEEVRFLLRRRSLEKLAADPGVSDARRVRFRAVLAARRFGADSLGLAVGGTYTTFVDVGRDTLVLVLSASPRHRLADYTWWFPVVGAVPYHGYFSLSAAQRESGRLERAGNDTYLRPAGAFSTLGWFSDPLFSTALTRDTVSLVETVLHEVTHNTVWVPGSVAFNESLAMFVGFRGAERFYRSRGSLAAAEQAAARWQDEKALGEFDTRLAASLDSLYRSGADAASLDEGRARVFRDARATIAGPLRRTLRVYPVDWLLNQPINNATLVASRVYHTKLELFDRVLLAKAGDLREAVNTIAAAARGDRRDPYGAVERWLISAAPHGGGTPPGGR